MKVVFVIKLLVLLGMISSFVLRKHHLPNANSWAIGIGKNPLLGSWLGDEMGDTLELVKMQLKETDTLFAQRYLCGQTADNVLVSLTIKNKQGEIIAESTDLNESLMFRADLPVQELLASPKMQSEDVLAVYFSIKEYDDNKEDYTILLGHLKLK